ncbi:elastase-1-like [Babylonia areolata]|uniref:elastase-1-like n=1 Tax=Babylonia areolata TaxID=304850 RepID=UPI003FD0ABBA
MEGSSSISLLLLLVTALWGCQAGPLDLRAQNTIRWGGMPDTGDNDTTLLTGGLNVRDNNPPIKDMRDWKVVGGTALSPNERPYLVLVYRFSGDTKSQWCGGSVIDKWHILSTASCLKYASYTYAIMAGEHNKGLDEASQQFRHVWRVFKHPAYDAVKVLNNIAVARLLSPLDLTSSAVSPANLNANDNCPEVNSTCSVAGWGYSAEGGQVTDVPHKVDLPVVPQSVCSDVYSPYTDYNDKLICAGEAGKSPCNGDGAAPLVCECGGVVYQAGVLNYGIGCGREGFPAAYTRVSSYLSWIQSIVNTNVC